MPRQSQTISNAKSALRASMNEKMRQRQARYNNTVAELREQLAKVRQEHNVARAKYAEILSDYYETADQNITNLWATCKNRHERNNAIIKMVTSLQKDLQYALYEYDSNDDYTLDDPTPKPHPLPKSHAFSQTPSTVQPKEPIREMDPNSPTFYENLEDSLP